MLLHLLLACAPSTPSLAPGEATDPRAAARETARMARPWSWEDNGPRAHLPALGLTAALDARGLQVEGPGAEPEALRIRARAWGRGTLTAPLPGRTREGSCAGEPEGPVRCVRRAERDLGGLVEWWVARDRGFQQGFDLHQRPAGEGPLRVELELQGAASLRAEGEDLRFNDRAGRAWTVSAPLAWDAQGRTLPIEAAIQGDRLILEVRDEGARWPLTIDPIYETTGLLLVGGKAEFGRASASGDLDGDGHADLLVAAPGIGNDNGRIYLYRGATSGPALTAEATYTGTQPQGRFGQRLAGPVDLDSDGALDLVVGAPGGSTIPGAVWLLRGLDGGFAAEAEPLLGEGSLRDEQGAALALLDLDGDGFTDLAVGAPGTSSSDGRLTIVYGGPAGLDPTRTQVLDGEESGGRFGAALAALPDLDGDGYPELAVASPWADGATGTVAILRGGPEGLAEEPWLELVGESSGASFGSSLSAGQDLDGDGLMELVVGAPDDDGTGSFIVFWGSDLASGVPQATTRSLETGRRFGAALALLPDVNGDGLDDLLVGGPGASGGLAGLYLGDAEGIAEEPDLSFLGEAGSELGLWLEGVADLDGDGLSDMLVGAPAQGGDQGALYLQAGGSPMPARRPARTWEGPAISLGYGQSLAHAGDIDGDGFADFAVGAWGSEQVQVHWGREEGPTALPDQVLESPEGSGGFGRALCGPGDLDGDGYDELVVSAPSWSRNQGVVFAFRGSPSGLESSASTRLEGPAASSYYGRALAGPGDLDADGYDDLLIGAYLYDSRAGRADWIPGGSGGLDTSRAVSLAAPESGAWFGFALAGLGDQNGDGYAEVAVSAPRTGEKKGRVYLYHGTSAGPSPSPMARLEGGADEEEFGRTLAAADLDGDGRLDLAAGAPGAASGAGRVDLFLTDGAGLPSSASRSITGGSGQGLGASLAAGDLEGDGWADLAVGAPDAAGAGLGRGAGRVQLHRGAEGGPSTSPSQELAGSRANQAFGAALAMLPPASGRPYGSLLIGSEASLAWLFAAWWDEDGDGVLAHEDCDDADPSVGVASLWRFVDRDEDGHGDPAGGAWRCEESAGWSHTDDDCADGDPAIHPGAAEIAGDGVDQDCDGADLPAGDGGAGDGGWPDGGAGDGGASDGGGGDGGAGDGGEPDGGTGDGGAPSEPEGKGGCGCASTGSGGGGLALLLGLLRRRPRRWARAARAPRPT